MSIEDLKDDVIKLINKIDSLEQKIINVDAKYKFKYNEIMLILEDNNGKSKNK